MAAQARSSSTVMFLIAFPLLIIPFAVYNIAAFLLDMDFHQRVFAVPLLSGRSMDVSMGDIVVMLAVLLLYAEILKSTRLSSRAIVDHVLSMLLFIAMLIEFITVPQAATSTFLILTALSLIDVIGGFTITIRTAQRDIEFQGADARVAGGA
jgi:hypothetical protein